MSSAPRRRLAVLSPLSLPELGPMLDASPFDWVAPPTRDQDGVHKVLLEADAVIGDFTGQLTLGEAEAAIASRVAFVQQMGAGVKTIDLDAWAEHDVPVANTAGANAAGVAEWCVGAAILSLRSMSVADAVMHAGGWPRYDVVARGCYDLGARRVGLVGLGPVGAACAVRFAAFGCPVSYWSRRRRIPAEEYGATYRDLDDLLRTSDVLVVAIALSNETRGLIDAARLALLPPAALVINAGRGGIVDEDALVHDVESGALHGAALDVFVDEPLSADSPLRRSDRILLSPHIAGGSVESRSTVVNAMGANLERAVRGEPVQSVVNGVAPTVQWRHL